MLNDWNADDTPAERALRQATADLRRALREAISDAEHALKRLDDGQRPGSSLYPGRVLDASKVNGYAAQVEAFLSLPWGGESGSLADGVAFVGDADRADEIVRTAGKVGA